MGIPPAEMAYRNDTPRARIWGVDAAVLNSHPVLVFLLVIIVPAVVAALTILVQSFFAGRSEGHWRGTMETRVEDLRQDVRDLKERHGRA